MWKGLTILFSNFGTNTTAQSRSIRIQKKFSKYGYSNRKHNQDTICFLLLISILSNKYLAQLFISTRVNRILDNLHILARGFSGNNETADRLIAKIIKSGLKFQVLYKNRNMFSQNQLRLLRDFGEEFNSLIEIVFELYDFDFMLRRLLFRSKCKDCQKLMHRIIGNHLTRKSHARIDFIFNFISNKEFLKYAFDSKSTFNQAIIRQIMVDLRALANDGLIGT
jgi:hypothetical protein